MQGREAIAESGSRPCWREGLSLSSVGRDTPIGPGEVHSTLLGLYGDHTVDITCRNEPAALSKRLNRWLPAELHVVKRDALRRGVPRSTRCPRQDSQRNSAIKHSATRTSTRPVLLD